MADIRSPRLLYLKGFLFLVSGILASALLLAENPTLKSAALLAVAVWSFARCYYFAFYVVEHYIDPGYRYRGLLSFVGSLIRRKEGRESTDERRGEEA